MFKPTHVSILMAGVLLAASTVAAEVTIVPLTSKVLEGREMAPVATAEPFFELASKAGAKYVEVSQYKSADGRFEVSVKRYERVTLKLRSWPIDEQMHFLTGKVQITDQSGHSHIYGPGESIVMPKGFVGEWKQMSTIEMITTTYSTNKP